MVSSAACHSAQEARKGEVPRHIACAATPNRVRRSAKAPRVSRSSTPVPQFARKRTAAQAVEGVGNFVSRAMLWTRSARARLDPLAHITCMKRARFDLPQPAGWEPAKLDVWRPVSPSRHYWDDLDVEKENRRVDAVESCDKRGSSVSRFLSWVRSASAQLDPLAHVSCMKRAKCDLRQPSCLRRVQFGRQTSTSFQGETEDGAQADVAEVAHVAASLRSFFHGQSQQHPPVDAITRCLRLHGTSKSLLVAVPCALKPTVRRSFDSRTIAEVLNVLEAAIEKTSVV